MRQGCAAVLLFGLLAGFLLLSCGRSRPGPVPRPRPVPDTVVVVDTIITDPSDSLIVVPVHVAIDVGDSVQFCAFGRLANGDTGVVPGNAPACDEAFRQWWATSHPAGVR